MVSRNARIRQGREVDGILVTDRDEICSRNDHKLRQSAVEPAAAGNADGITLEGLAVLFCAVGAVFAVPSVSHVVYHYRFALLQISHSDAKLFHHSGILVAQGITLGNGVRIGG